MTRTPTRRLLAVALATALAPVLSVQAQSATPQSPKDVNISKGADAQGETAGGGSCTNSSCRWVNFTATGFAPNTSYNWQCHASNGAFGSGGSVTTDGNGRVSRGAPVTCYYGFPGQQVWVIFGGVRSNTINW